MSEPLPKVIGGRYQVVRKLGQGGMGAVYEAVDSATNRTVAIKTIIAALASDPTLMERFEREAKAAAALDTPHVVAVLDAGRDEAAEVSYMVMEYLDGEDFQHVLRRVGPIAPDLALRVAAQACLALQKAHDKRIVHRDIKPANLFLSKREGGQRLVKLLDFGVAKVRKEATRSNVETKGLTRTGSMLGSPVYMSPEQARGHKDVDHRSDIWSLGVVLYQALAGRTPHGDTDELGELIILICTEPPELIQNVAPWVPPEVAAVVHRAMRFSPAERYASAGEMLAAIAPLLQGSMAISESMLRPLQDAERLTIAPRLHEASIHDAPPPRRSSATQGGDHADGGGPYSHGTLAMGGQNRPSGSFPGAPPGFPGAPPYAESQTGAPQGYPGPASYPGAAAYPGPASYPGAPPASMSYPGAQNGPSTLSAGVVGTTMQGAPASASAPAKSRVPLVLAAIGAVAIGGVLAAFAVPRRAPEAALASTAAPSASADESAAKIRTVKLVVLPDDVRVEVDGAPVQPKDGVVEIRGALGSEHKVRLFRLGDHDGGAVESEIERVVVVAQHGASPAKLDLSVVAPGSSGAPSAPVKRVRGPMPKPNTGHPVLRTKR